MIEIIKKNSQNQFLKIVCYCDFIDYLNPSQSIVLSNYYNSYKTD